MTAAASSASAITSRMAASSTSRSTSGRLLRRASILTPGSASLKVVAIGVHSPDYPAWLLTEVAAFGTFGLVWLAATFAIVERRRPF